MMKFLKKYSDLNWPMRCNDISLPFGGAFPKHKGHGKGQNVDLRYMDDQGVPLDPLEPAGLVDTGFSGGFVVVPQNYYDHDDAANRRRAVRMYQTFSQRAWAIATGRAGVAPADYDVQKAALITMCNTPPVTGCPSGTVTDLNHAETIKVCLLNYGQAATNACFAGDEYEQIGHYAYWANLNINRWTQMYSDLFKIVVSFGGPYFSGEKDPKNWAELTYMNGLFPNIPVIDDADHSLALKAPEEIIYTHTGSTIIDQKIGCTTSAGTSMSNCRYPLFIDGGSEHLDHMHLEIN